MPIKDVARIILGKITVANINIVTQQNALNKNSMQYSISQLKEVFFSRNTNKSAGMMKLTLILSRDFLKLYI